VFLGGRASRKAPGGHALEGVIGTPIHFSSLHPGHCEVNSFVPPTAPAMMFSLNTGLKVIEPADHALKLLKA
jgi:hypothetical protein